MAISLAHDAWHAYPQPQPSPTIESRHAPEEATHAAAGWVEGKNGLKPDPIDFAGLCGYFGGQG